MKCIISCAVDNGHRPYQELLREQRLTHQRICPEIPRLDWTGKWPPGARPHTSSQYGFKVFAFAEAFRQNYDLVLWLDSCITLLRHPQKLFEMVESDGYLIQHGGALLEGSIRPDLLRHLGATVAPDWCIASGQIVGFNRHHATGMSLYKRWSELEAGNWFNEGSFPFHRTDEACLGLILQRDGLPFSRPTGHYTEADPIYMSYWYTHDLEASDKLRRQNQSGTDQIHVHSATAISMNK